MYRLHRLLFLLTCLTTPSLAQDNAFKVYWQDSLRLETEDGKIQLRFGGRIHNDWGFFEADQILEDLFGSFDDAAEIRRARIYLSGTLYTHVEFKLQYDFAGGEVQAKDVYFGIKGIPGLGGFRVGHFKEPFSLEELTSSNNHTFMERSVMNAFSPSRNIGFLVHNSAAGDQLTWAFGVFREGDGFGVAEGDDNYSFTGRLTGLPWLEGDTRLIHLGLSYSHRRPPEDKTRVRARPPVHLLPRVVDTTTLRADSVDLVAPEFALVYDAFSLQTEYTYARIDRLSGPEADLYGYYVQASFFVTGESRRYSKSSGTFSGIKPARNFLIGDGGPGAWEIAARFSQIDLDDDPVAGGKLSEFTFGVNWYLNPNSRILWNYVYADRDDLGDANAFQARFQVNF